MGAPAGNTTDAAKAAEQVEKPDNDKPCTCAHCRTEEGD